MAELRGKIYRIDKVQEFNSGFRKRVVVIQSGKNYFPVALREGDISLLDVYQVGDDITVAYEMYGTLWTNREGKEMNFIDLNGRIIASPDKAVLNNTIQSAQEAGISEKPQPIVLNDKEPDDLPF